MKPIPRRSIAGLDNLSDGAIAVAADLQRLDVGVVTDPANGQLFLRLGPGVTPDLIRRVSRHAHELNSLLASQPAALGRVPRRGDSRKLQQVQAMLRKMVDEGQMRRLLAYPDGPPALTPHDVRASRHMSAFAEAMLDSKLDPGDAVACLRLYEQRTRRRAPAELAEAVAALAGEQPPLRPTDFAFRLCCRAERLNPGEDVWPR